MRKNDNRMEIYGDIYRFLDVPKTREWMKQQSNPYCFLQFNPLTKQITICRWGKSCRPPRTDALLWQRMKIQGFSIDNKVFEALKRWLDLWDNVAFNPFSSDPVPDAYPNTKFSNTIPIQPLFNGTYR